MCFMGLRKQLMAFFKFLVVNLDSKQNTRVFKASLPMILEESYQLQFALKGFIDREGFRESLLGTYLQPSPLNKLDDTALPETLIFNIRIDNNGFDDFSITDSIKQFQKKPD